jgi:CheY-like chemotaxis protein
MVEGRTVLIIEDNQLNLDLFTFVLERAGWKVVSAMDPEQARAWLDSPPPDIILMDIQLPGCDGQTLAKEFRQKPGFETVPIVALTAHAMRGDRERFLAVGFNGYIAKPIQVRTFSDEVAQFLKIAEVGSGLVY